MTARDRAFFILWIFGCFTVCCLFPIHDRDADIEDIEDIDNEPVEVCGSDSIQMPPVGDKDADLCLSPRQQAFLQHYRREPPPTLKPGASRHEAGQYELELSAWRMRQF